jgi:hypothetical protein
MSTFKNFLRSPLGPVPFQMVLMLIGTTMFHVSDYASELTYEKLGFLESYVPALYRYRAAFGQTHDFDQYFSIRVFQIAVQLPFLAIYAARVLRAIMTGRLFRSYKVGAELVFVTGIILCVLPSADLFLGSYDIAHPRITSEYAHGFVRCLLLPIANMMLSTLVISYFMAED